MEKCQSGLEVHLEGKTVRLKFYGICPGCYFLYTQLFPFIKKLILDRIKGVEEVEMED